MLYQNRLALGGVVGNVLGKVRDAMTPQQNKPKTQQSSQEATQADATSRKSEQAPQANMEQRFAAFEASRMDPRRDEAKLYAADQSARTALDALNTFSEGPGASILNRIQDAASTTRGGIQQVLAEMRPGGAYEDLRKEFNTVLNDDPAFRSTYGHAADALKQYGKARESIIKTIPNQPNAKEWTAHFEKLDAEIGETASNIPGREKGSALENLAEKAREIVEAIINKVRDALGYEARAESSPSPSASP
jgi:Sec-independent protein translocase protein TatA